MRPTPAENFGARPDRVRRVTLLSPSADAVRCSLANSPGLSGGRAHRALDRRLDTIVSHASTQRAVHRRADLGIAWIGIAIEQRFCRHDLTVLAIAALRGLLVDPRLLQRMQFAILGKTFERRDVAACRRDRRDARAHRRAIDDHGTHAALP